MGDLFPQVLDLGVMITDEDWQQLKTQDKEPLHFLFRTSVAKNSADDEAARGPTPTMQCRHRFHY